MADENKPPPLPPWEPRKIEPPITDPLIARRVLQELALALRALADVREQNADAISEAGGSMATRDEMEVVFREVYRTLDLALRLPLSPEERRKRASDLDLTLVTSTLIHCPKHAKVLPEDRSHQDRDCKACFVGAPKALRMAAKAWLEAEPNIVERLTSGGAS